MIPKHSLPIGHRDFTARFVLSRCLDPSFYRKDDRHFPSYLCVRHARLLRIFHGNLVAFPRGVCFFTIHFLIVLPHLTALIKSFTLLKRWDLIIDLVAARFFGGPIPHQSDSRKCSPASYRRRDPSVAISTLIVPVFKTTVCINADLWALSPDHPRTAGSEGVAGTTFAGREIGPIRSPYQCAPWQADPYRCRTGGPTRAG